MELNLKEMNDQLSKAPEERIDVAKNPSHLPQIHTMRNLHSAQHRKSDPLQTINDLLKIGRDNGQVLLPKGDFDEKGEWKILIVHKYSVTVIQVRIDFDY